MNTSPPAADTSPEQLRDLMVERILRAGYARSERVEHAMRIAPRHRFVPDVPAEQAYADRSVITKRDDTGNALSCASEPPIVAMMLDQLDVRPGDRVLEIGAGTGYNAALLDHLAGPSGQVTTVDIDPETTSRARRALDATGHRQVKVITRDGALGAAEHEPYDRVIVTVGAWDLPPSWPEQLLPGGRLVVPLRWRGQTRSVAFVRDDHSLHSDSVQLCGFVPMVGQSGERSAAIDPDGQVTLRWDADQPIEPAALHAVLDQPKTTTWSAQTVGINEPFDGVWLRLTTDPGTCRISASLSAVESGLCAPANRYLSPAIVHHDSLAYFTQRRLDDNPDNPRWELGATGHGPSGPQLAERLTDGIRAWSPERTTEPLITAYPATTPHDELTSGYVIHKLHTRLVVRY